MSWVEKRKTVPFEDQPIDGLFFLNGDALARYSKQPWTAGLKQPMIAFSSGIECPLREGYDAVNPFVHLFGELALPLKATRDEALLQAKIIAELAGYAVRAVANAAIEVQGATDAEHFLLVYDPQARLLINVVPLIEKVQSTEPLRSAPLLDRETRERLPALYSGEQLGLEALAQVKFFTPDSNWTWYASEGSPVDEDGYFDTNKEKIDYLFFGLVSGFEVELGYFSLSELEAARGPLGLPIERGLDFEPKTLSSLKALHNNG